MPKRITDKQISQIRALHKRGVKTKVIAEEVGVSSATVWRNRDGRQEKYYAVAQKPSSYAIVMKAIDDEIRNLTVKIDNLRRVKASL